MVILPDAPSNTLHLLCYHRLMSTDTNLLWQRSVSSSPNPHLVLDTEVHGSSYSLLSLRSYQITADLAKRAGLFSQGLHGNQRILTGEPGDPLLWFSAITPGSGIPEFGADEDARRAEGGRGGTTLSALAHDRQTISSSTHPKSASAFENLPHLCVFHTPALDGDTDHRFRLGCPRSFLQVLLLLVPQ